MTTLLSVFTNPYILTLEEQIVAAKKVGFDGVAYVATINDLFFAPNYVLELTKKHEVPIKAVHIPIYLVLYTPPLLLNNIVKLLSYFPESENFNFHLSCFLNLFGRNMHGLERFKKIMINNNIPISCESNPDEYYFFKYFPKETYDPDSFATFCIKQKLPINLDTSHIAAWNYDIVTFFERYHKYINLLHASDMTPTKQHLSFGRGDLPLIKLFKKMKNLSYKGTVIFEISNFPKGTSKENVVEELKQSISMLKKYT